MPVIAAQRSQGNRFPPPPLGLFLYFAPATSYTHDANGNRLTETEPGGTITYNWDARNRLESIETPTDVTVFRYDFAGNLIGKDTGVPGPIITQSQHFVLDELTNVVFESNSNGTQFSYLTGQIIDEHFAAVQSTGQVEYGLSDVLNSTVITVDESENSAGKFQYEPFGETTSLDTSYPFQFTGRVTAMGDLYHYRERYYDPLAGRFVSEDPLPLFDSSSLYRYVNNNPINFLYPTGNQARTPNQGDCPRTVKECQEVCIAVMGIRNRHWCFFTACNVDKLCKGLPKPPCLPPHCSCGL